MTSLTPRQAAENAAFPFADFLADPARHLVCAAIPKSGCSELKHWFVSLVEPARLADPSFRLHAYCRATHTLASFAPERRAELLRDSFTLAFVRDPLSRVVSAYVEKFARPAPHELFDPAKEVIARIAPTGAEGITFREFVRFLEHAPDDHLDSHWRPQSSFLAGVRIDLLARMESIVEILDLLGRELRMPPHAPRRRNSTGYTPPTGRIVADTLSAHLHENGVLPPADDLYDDDLHAIVQSRFQEDALLYKRAVATPSGGVLELFRRTVCSSRAPAIR